MSFGQYSQADVFAALQAQSSSSRRRPTTTPYAEISEPFSTLTSSPADVPVNSRRVYCPREGCGSLILLPEAAEWITAPADLIPIEEGSPFSSTPTHPTSSTPNEAVDGKNGYWYIKGGPMAFENIGYSRPSDKTLPPDAPGMESGKKVKWLICAECDLGPVGWSFEGGQESWLDVGRLRYGEPAQKS